MMSSLIKKLWTCAALALAAMLIASTHANAAVINGITWLEVSDTNSTVASGSILKDSGVTANDNNWDYTTPFGVIGPGDNDERGGTPLGSGPGTGNGTGMLAKNNSEDPGALTVTYNGILLPSTPYTIYVAFRGASDQEGVEVSLDNSNWVQHTFNGADTDLDDDFDVTATTVLGQDSNGAEYYYVDAGIGTVSGVSDLTVYFREPTTDIPGSSSNPFTWSIIDAVGIKVIPEPASLALLGLGGAVILGGRRRRA